MAVLISFCSVLKWHYGALDPDERGLNETRGYACEIVAWRFLTSLSQSELIDYLLYELPSTTAKSSRKSHDPLHRVHFDHDDADESQDNGTAESSLLSDQEDLGHDSTSHGNQDPLRRDMAKRPQDDPTSPFIGLNALEIAAVADAKGFLSQRVVQKIVTGIWRGDIMFWDSLNVRTKKKAQLYNQRWETKIPDMPRSGAHFSSASFHSSFLAVTYKSAYRSLTSSSKADPYARIRVPRYQKVFEALFFGTFLALYYAVLVERNPRHITFIEVLLYIWIAAFSYEELGEFTDAGTLFYAADFWSLWDLGIIGVGVAFLISRVIGLAKDSDRIIDISFDILSLEALFLVPR
ncbi:MAG: hypothetical protein Q9187_003020 [Circinaria calcarea]